MELDATNIYGPQGRISPDQIQTVSWTFGDGKTGQGSQTSHDYASKGIFVVQADLTTKGGEKLKLMRTIEIGG